MLNDSRYTVESWLRQNVSEQASIGFIGSKTYHPRFHDLPTKDVLKVDIADVDSCSLKQMPDFLVVSSGHDINRYPEGTVERQKFSNLYEGKADYQQVFRHKSIPKWNLLKIEPPVPLEYYDKRLKKGNINKINPDIRIFERQQLPSCIPAP